MLTSLDQDDLRRLVQEASKMVDKSTSESATVLHKEDDQKRSETRKGMLVLMEVWQSILELVRYNRRCGFDALLCKALEMHFSVQKDLVEKMVIRTMNISIEYDELEAQRPVTPKQP